MLRSLGSRLIVASLLIALVPAAALAAVDLTTLGATATIQSVIFSQGDASTPGATLHLPFLRVMATSVEQGFNTDFRPLEPDAVGTPTVTHSVRFNALRRGLISTPSRSDYYYEFYVDVNESTISGGSFLSVDQLRIYGASDPSIPNLATLQSSAALLYDMDALSDQQLLLDAALAPGSGSVDLTIQIPISVLGSPPDTSYLYLFLRAGGAGSGGGRDYGSSGGFEEILASMAVSPSGVEPVGGAAAPWVRPIGGPLGSELRFRVSVPGAGPFRIVLYDARGASVATLEGHSQGPRVFEAPLSSFHGARPASGIYFYRFEWGGQRRSVGRVVLLR